MNPRIHFELARIQPHQHAPVVARIILQLIDLVFDDETARPLRHARKLGIFHNDRSLKRAPGMLVEVAADHLAILGPVGERDGRAMDADEAFAVVVNEREEIGLLLVVHLERAARIEEHRIEIVQVLGIEFKLLLRERLRCRCGWWCPTSPASRPRRSMVAIACEMASCRKPFSSPMTSSLLRGGAVSLGRQHRAQQAQQEQCAV